MLTFTDCAVVRYPTAAQLADIALSPRRIVGASSGDEPRVAFLSFSTREAESGRLSSWCATLALVRSRDRPLVVDGELQGDAALVPLGCGPQGAGQLRWRASERARVPIARRGQHRLQAGAATRLGASAIGPILQGLRATLQPISRAALRRTTLSMWPPSPRCKSRDGRARLNEPPGDKT